jgi:hypothetical protein
MSRPVWRAASLPAAAVCATLIVACGGGTGAIAKTRAREIGRAVNVHLGDAPGMAMVAPSFETKSGPPYSGCTTRVATADQVAAVESPWLVRYPDKPRSGVRLALAPSVEGVHSVVYVMRDPAVANGNVASGRRAGVPECVTRRSAKESTGRFVGREPYKLSISGSWISFPLAGVAGYGLRVQGTLAAGVYHLRKRPAYYEDTFGFAVGPAEIVLHASGVGRPFPASEERRLLLLLYDRAEVHALSR